MGGDWRLLELQCKRSRFCFFDDCNFCSFSISYFFAISWCVGKRLAIAKFPDIQSSEKPLVFSFAENKRLQNWPWKAIKSGRQIKHETRKLLQSRKLLQRLWILHINCRRSKPSTFKARKVKIWDFLNENYQHSRCPGVSFERVKEPWNDILELLLALQSPGVSIGGIRKPLGVSKMGPEASIDGIKREIKIFAAP